MRRPKWLCGWGRGKNILEGSLIIDLPDLKVVETSFNRRLVLVAIGTIQLRGTAVSREATVAVPGEKHGTDLKWRIFYDATIFTDFMPIDRVKDSMAGAVAVLSGSAAVYDTGTVYIASGDKPSKGNAPLLLDYEIAKKIEEEKKKKQAELNECASS